MYTILILSIFVIILLVIVIVILKKKKQVFEIKKLNLFIENADQVLVDLKNVEIKSNSWKEEIYLNSSAAEIDQLASDPNRGKETIYHNLNTLIFSIPYKSKLLDFQEQIDMERKTLDMKIAIKGETTLYINPNNSDDYFLDLKFLD